jgi:hypothetical protein
MYLLMKWHSLNINFPTQDWEWHPACGAQMGHIHTVYGGVALRPALNRFLQEKTGCLDMVACLSQPYGMRAAQS